MADSKPLPPFKRLVAIKRKEMLEHLTAGGEFHDVTEQSAIDEDWLSVLAEFNADIHLELRRTSDDEVDYARKAIIHALAKTVATCEAWAEQIRKEIE